MRIPLFHIDAFTGQPFTGNPAAVCLLRSWLDDGLLGKVAAENNLSATAFLVRQGESYELRWFTPRREIQLCGHATLAAGFVVLHLLQPNLGNVRFATRFGGTLTVQRDADLFSMDLPAFLPKPCANVFGDLIRALGLAEQPSEVLEGNETYIAVLAGPEAVSSVRPDFGLLGQLHPHAVMITAPGRNSDFVLRYFAPSYGNPEDPVTGSAHCLLAPYWTKRLGKPTLHAQQLSERGGEAWCEPAGERVRVKGHVRLVMQGSLTI
jgi:PhzF family phenazine biosynthesis protein